MPRDNLQEALRLAARGFKLVPLHTAIAGKCDCHRPACPTPGKHPRITEWQRRGSDALDDITNWWGMWPAANVGIACELSGIVVIDVDPRNGGDDTVEEWVRQHGDGWLWQGPACRTGGGGQHFYFRHPGGRVLSHTIAPGVDVKAGGGQVVAPPSVHVSGVSYAWYDGCGPERELPPLPDWLLALVSSTEDVRGEQRVVPDAIPEGARHQYLLSFAGAMRTKGASRDVIFAALMALNEERCQPPLSRGEVAQLAADVARRYEPGEAFIYSKKALEKPQVPRDLTPYKASDLRDMEFGDVRWAVPGLLPEGLALLCGPIKLGKSWWALGAAVDVAYGQPALGSLTVEGGYVLALMLEDSRRRMKDRIAKLVGDRPDWPDRLECADMTNRWPRADQGGVEAIDAWLGQHPDARLVIIDTLQKFRSGKPRGNGNAYSEDYLEMEPLHELANRHRVCILLLHHYNKALHDDWVDRISGTAGIGGVADTLIALIRPRGQDGQKEAQMRVTGRDVEEHDYAMAFDAGRGRWEITGDAEDAAAGRESRKLVELMAKVGRPVNAEMVAAGLDKTKPAAARLLQRSALNNITVAVGSGFYVLAATSSLEDDVAGVVGSATSKNGDKTTPTTPATSATPATKVGKLDSISATANLSTKENRGVSDFSLAGEATTSGATSGATSTANVAVSDHNEGVPDPDAPAGDMPLSTEMSSMSPANVLSTTGTPRTEDTGTSGDIFSNSRFKNSSERPSEDDVSRENDSSSFNNGGHHQMSPECPDVPEVDDNPHLDPDAPAVDCPECGQRRWTRRIGGAWKCEVCRPAVRVVGAPQDGEAP